MAKLKAVNLKASAKTTMWHEARKQERKIRGMMVDYKKRAERRREYYEKIKADPTQFLQIHGRPSKIHLDPTVAQAAETPATMMPWQGNQDNLIDRFDVRAHLDHIPEYKSTVESEATIPVDDSWEERQANYERYRTLVQNDFLIVAEEKFLYQIFLEEQFGPIGKSAEEEKKKLVDKKAAIGYTYEDSTPQPSTTQQQQQALQDEDDEKKDSDSDIDLDVTIDVDELNIDQGREMNDHALKYGMAGDDFITLLHKDKEEAEALRLAKEAEEEKAMYSGRKSRRERRAFREKKLQGRKISPPSYAARESPTYDPYKRAKSASRSRSRSPVNCGQITYITSFGGEGSEESDGDKMKARKGIPAVASTSTGIIGPTLPKPVLPASVPSTSHGVHSVSVTRKRGDSRSSRSRSRSRSPLGPRYRSHRNSSRRKHPYSRSRSRSRSRNRDKRYRSYSNSSSKSHSSTSSRRHSSSSHSRARSSSVSSSHSLSRSRSRTRSPSPHSGRRKSRSRSKSSSRSSRSNSSSVSSRKLKNKSKSRSRSPSQQQSQPAQLRSYYQRCKQDVSSSSLSDDSDGGRQDDFSASYSSSAKALSSLGKPGPGSKKLTPKERLKRKMQAALNRQFKADKKAEQKKMEKLEQERQDREEELREMAIKLRRRERERRHRMLEAERERVGRDHRGSSSRSPSASPIHSLSRSPSPSPSDSNSGSESESESNSPKRVSRWDRKRRSRSRSRSPVKH